MESIITCIDLTKKYQIFDESIRALSEINLDIKKGEFICFVGPSGSGKTTLLNLLGLLDKPSSGEIVVDGKSISQMTSSSIDNIRRENFGYVFQRPNLLPTLTVYKNIELTLLIQNKIKGTTDRKKLIFELLKFLELDDKIYNYPSQLSIGQQQRIALARAIIHKPSVLLLDEPTGSLDRENSDLIVDILKKLFIKFNSTILLVTHDLQVAKAGTKILYLEDGIIIE